MVLYVLKWDIIPSKAEEYQTWARFAIKRTVDVPGVIETCAYRPVAGHSQVVTTYAFTNFESWATWFSHPIVQSVFNELFSLATNVHRELWEPSPIIPEPIRPGARGDVDSSGLPE